MWQGKIQKNNERAYETSLKQTTPQQADGALASARHTVESRCPQTSRWIPAFAGMTIYAVNDGE